MRIGTGKVGKYRQIVEKNQYLAKNEIERKIHHLEWSFCSFCLLKIIYYLWVQVASIIMEIAGESLSEKLPAE